MDRLVSRSRRLTPLRSISDAMLFALLAHSEPVPDSIQQRVVLFERGEPTASWYLLLSGEVELFRTSRNGEFSKLKTLHAGTLFGELTVPVHSCSGLVSRPSQLVRIPQNHFLSIYNKHGDHLQAYIVVMNDLSSEYGETPQLEMPPAPSNGHYETPILTRMHGVPGPSHTPRTNGFERNFVELSSKISVDRQIEEAGDVLQKKMLTDSRRLVRDVVYHNNTHRSCMSGSEMVEWLLSIFVQFSDHSQTLSRFQMTAIWQVLLEQNVVAHVGGEMIFYDKQVYYRWTRPCDPRMAMHTTDDVAQAVSLLASIAPDALFRLILSKPGFERCPEELELVYEELVNIKALSHLSTMVKRQLAAVVQIEQHSHAGSVVFRQGDVGHRWFIILRGAVDVTVHTKGTVCTLQEGDDFGKLALVNDSPRAATIITRHENSQFLTVDKHHFNQILQEVEANTVRLREFGEDVLVLEKIELPRGVALETNLMSQSMTSSHSGYSVMAGKAEKILEYILETRMDAQSPDLNEVDVLLEDFILTHEAFMPTNSVCNYLKTYYFRPPYYHSDGVGSDGREEVCTRRRVVVFIHVWCSLLNFSFFLNPAGNSFIEELFCYVSEDHLRFKGMRDVVAMMTALRSAREHMQGVLARHPATVLDCGVLSAYSPTPILPQDICNQIIHVADTTCFVLPLRVDKTASEICELARRRLRTIPTEPLVLVEAKTTGEKTLFSPNDRAIPTMLSLNSKLYVVQRDQVDSLHTQFDQYGAQTDNVHSSLLHIVDASELAHQLFTFHLHLIKAADTSELIAQAIGRESFPFSMPYNVDILVRRFNELQYWATTEVLLAADANRAEILKKFIKIAACAKENQDLMTLFAIILGLSHVAVSRLTQTWNRVPTKLRKKYAEFETLLDPTRNHRAYRSIVSKLQPPYIPFIPLLLKDLVFIHQGNKSFYNGLVNFEKMHMFANILRTFRQCKVTVIDGDSNEERFTDTANLVRNLRVIDNQRRLMQISYQIEAKTSSRRGVSADVNSNGGGIF